MVLSTLLDPSLLIADEITSALDVSTQKAVAEMLVEFRERGFVKSMIVITHDISILYQVADTILVMYAGQLAEKAPADVIIDSPRHPYTKLLISSLPEVGVRYDDKRLSASPARRPRCSTRPGLPLPRSLPARHREVRSSSRRSSRSSRTTSVACLLGGGARSMNALVLTSAEARPRLQGRTRSARSAGRSCRPCAT
jgi:ABC-type dipeptide/oligopeptide/nickel transport system ATPase component